MGIQIASRFQLVKHSQLGSLAGIPPQINIKDLFLHVVHDILSQHHKIPLLSQFFFQRLYYLYKEILQVNALDVFELGTSHYKSLLKLQG